MRRRPNTSASVSSPGKGSMSGRVVIPIENERGELVAYAGRSIDGREPKYKLPAGFKKSQVLYNLARALEEDSTGAVVLVEGFFDCIKVVQAEHVCVALMGCSLSEDQEVQLVGSLPASGHHAGRRRSRPESGRGNCWPAGAQDVGARGGRAGGQAVGPTFNRRAAGVAGGGITQGQNSCGQVMMTGPLFLCGSSSGEEAKPNVRASGVKGARDLES